uniref:PDZ domain containing 1 n=1 Tax=Sphenodon punctatus TaxID=8508 RepID=A0A8D0L8B6_SPHPU
KPRNETIPPMALACQPRECKLTKHDGESFGFLLRLEKYKTGHLIRNVEKGGPADKAGLKDGDRVLKVNGLFVDKQDHGQTVRDFRHSVRAFNSTIRTDRVQIFSKKVSSQIESFNLSKLYTINGKSTLNFICQKGLFIIDLSPQGAATKAGMQQNDRLIEVNGENVENDTHEDVVEKVKKSGNHVVFLLSNKETDQYYSNQNRILKRETASLKLLPHKPRMVELTKGSDGYGFYLRMEQNGKGHLIRDIDSGSPAAKAGLKDNDLLVAVNGESVENFDHNGTVEKIQRCGGKTTLLVVDQETDVMYKMAQVSPCLYYHEMEEPSRGEAEEVPMSLAKQKNHKPRICKPVKGLDGFGFHLNAIKNLPGQFIKEVKKGRPADTAGLEEDDILVEVNGVNVVNESYEKVVGRIHDAGDRLTLLVCSEEAYEYFKSQNIAITASIADPVSEPEDPPAYTEYLTAKPERASLEPRERVVTSAEDEDDEDTQL